MYLIDSGYFKLPQQKLAALFENLKEYMKNYVFQPEMFFSNFCLNFHPLVRENSKICQNVIKILFRFGIRRLLIFVEK